MRIPHTANRQLLDNLTLCDMSNSKSSSGQIHIYIEKANQPPSIAIDSKFDTQVIRIKIIIIIVYVYDIEGSYHSNVLQFHIRLLRPKSIQRLPSRLS